MMTWTTCCNKTRCLAVLFTLLFTLQLTGCRVIDTVKSLSGGTPMEEELMGNMPRFDTDAFNRFHFTMDVTAGSMDGEAKEINFSGVVETYKNISHLYNLDGNVPEETKAESWSSFSENVRYQKGADGWTMAELKDTQAVNKLAEALNVRDADLILTKNDSVCTLSWSFPIDARELFGPILESEAENLTGSGRVTAVFDPESHAFEHFTIVASAGNEEKDGVLLDAVFYWDTINSRTEGLKIPDEVSAGAYKAATGVNSVGYNEEVNPVAEDFMKAYGGTAEVTHYEDGAMMFWTFTKDDISAVVNYAVDKSASARFEESLTALSSVCGAPVEETENGRYFYNDETKELTYMAVLDHAYAEIIVAGSDDMNQADLRMPLIDYKSRLGV